MTGILLSPEDPPAATEAAMRAAADAVAAGGEVVLFAGGPLRTAGMVPAYPLADAFNWRGGLVATGPDTLRVMAALPRRGPRALFLDSLDGLAAGWAFRDLHAALAATRLCVPRPDLADRLAAVWGLAAAVTPFPLFRD